MRAKAAPSPRKRRRGPAPIDNPSDDPRERLLATLEDARVRAWLARLLGVSPTTTDDEQKGATDGHR